MARYVFTSFRFKDDYDRAQLVRNMGAIEGNTILNPNDWEKKKREGDQAIKTWIGQNMQGKSCVLVLVGRNTAESRWVQYEIKKSMGRQKRIIGSTYRQTKRFKWFAVSSRGKSFLSCNRRE